MSMTWADIFDELKLICDEIIQLLKLGAFELSKWVSNCPELLEIDNRDCVLVIIRDNTADSWIVGMQWNQYQDSNFSANLKQKPTLCVKTNHTFRGR